MDLSRTLFDHVKEYYAGEEEIFLKHKKIVKEERINEIYSKSIETPFLTFFNEKDHLYEKLSNASLEEVSKYLCLEKVCEQCKSNCICSGCSCLCQKKDVRHCRKCCYDYIK